MPEAHSVMSMAKSMWEKAVVSRHGQPSFLALLQITIRAHKPAVREERGARKRGRRAIEQLNEQSGQQNKQQKQQKYASACRTRKARFWAGFGCEAKMDGQNALPNCPHLPPERERPYEIIGLGAMNVTKPYRWKRFGDIHSLNPMSF